MGDDERTAESKSDTSSFHLNKQDWLTLAKNWNIAFKVRSLSNHVRNKKDPVGGKKDLT